MSQTNSFRLILIFVMFFFVSLLTNITGPLVPDVIKSFHLNLTLAAFLPFSFFVAYAFMSLPSGILVERFGDKPVLLGSFGLAFSGSALFALHPDYLTALGSLFLIGLGMAALQVVINPLLRATGGETNYAFNAVLAQLIFGVASFLSPFLYSHFAEGHAKDLVSQALLQFVPIDLPWMAVYWVFACLALSMIVTVVLAPFPKLKLAEQEKVGTLRVHLRLFCRPLVWLYFFGIFAYVGLEQGLSNWISQFLSVAHHLNPQVEGAAAVSNFWLCMTFGCVLGLVALKVFESRKILIGACLIAGVGLTAALFGSATLSVWGFPLCGFALSVMWSILFSLALNSVREDHGTFSGILCTGVVGGAVVPLLIGRLGDYASLKQGLYLLYLPLVYIFAIGVWARPLVSNVSLPPLEEPA